MNQKEYLPGNQIMWLSFNSTLHRKTENLQKYCMQKLKHTHMMIMYGSAQDFYATFELTRRLTKLDVICFFSNLLSISSHISENLSDPRLFKYTWIGHFMECQSEQEGQNSWHMRQFLAPKCLISALFSSPKIIFKRNFTTISIIFFIKH